MNKTRYTPTHLGIASPSGGGNLSTCFTNANPDSVFVCLSIAWKIAHPHCRHFTLPVVFQRIYSDSTVCTIKVSIRKAVRGMKRNVIIPLVGEGIRSSASHSHVPSHSLSTSAFPYTRLVSYSPTPAPTPFYYFLTNYQGHRSTIPGPL